MAWKILIVEDTSISRKLMEDLLRGQGFECFGAGDGRQALQILKNQDIDLILLDILMPGMDGIETLDHIRKQWRSSELPVIMVSALGNNSDLLAAFEKGANDYIIKPFDAEITLARIGTQLELLNSRNKLGELHESFQLALRGSRDGIWEWNIRAKKVRFSPRWMALLGFESEPLPEQWTSWLRRVHSDDRSAFLSAFRSFAKSRESIFEYELRMQHKKGHMLLTKVRGMAVRDKKGVAKIAGSLSDLTAEKIFDQVTGLPNQILFEEQLAKALLQKWDFSVSILSMKRLRVISQSYGQHAADLVVFQISERIRQIIGDEDMLARSSGNKLLLLHQGLHSEEEWKRWIEEVEASCGRPFYLGKEEIRIEINCGTVPEAGKFESPLEIVQAARTALNQAQSQTGEIYRVYTIDMKKAARESLSLENNLRLAMENNELSLHYQPQVDLATGKTMGLEALMRWNHPELGNIPPFRFIPVAEETGLIIPIGQWAVEEACRQAKNWSDRGYDKLRVSVNLSFRQFNHRNLVEMVRDSILDANMNAERLDIEITESSVMENPDLTIQTMKRLKDLGVALSVDDFGTGYSSLARLKSFPLSILKIDRAFVKDLPGSRDDAVITQTIIDLAHNLGFSIIAEGAETKEQVDFLKERGCEVIQGYYFSKPLPADQVEGFLIG